MLKVSFVERQLLFAACECATKVLQYEGRDPVRLTSNEIHHSLTIRPHELCKSTNSFFSTLRAMPLNDLTKLMLGVLILLCKSI